MTQNIPQHTVQNHIDTDCFATEENKNQDSRVLTAIDIYISPDDSNADDKSNKLSLSNEDQAPLKNTKHDEISCENIRPSLEKEINSENLFEVNKKPESEKSSKKDFPRQSKNISIKCWNKLCLAKGIKKTKSKVNGRYFWLCQTCCKLYNDSQCCEFCEQIYAQEEVDGLEWIQCQTKGCGRWNHTICQKKQYAFNPQNLYFCTKCRCQPNSKNNEHGQNLQSVINFKTNKRDLQSIYSNRVPIFHKLRENFGYLESMLSSYSYKLSLSEDQLKHDKLFFGAKEMICSNNLYPEVDRSYKKRKLR